MAYTKVNFVDGSTPLNKANLGNMDDYIAVLDAVPKVPTVVNGQWLKGSGGALVWSPIAVADLPSGIPASLLSAYPSSASKALKGDGTWGDVWAQIDGGGTSFGTNIKAQCGQTTISVGTGTDAAPAGVTVPLPYSWPTSHLLFFASASPGTTWAGFSQKNLGSPNSNGSGYVPLINATAQSFIFFWISLGR